MTTTNITSDNQMAATLMTAALRAMGAELGFVRDTDGSYLVYAEEDSRESVSVGVAVKVCGWFPGDDLGKAQRNAIYEMASDFGTRVTTIS